MTYPKWVSRGYGIGEVLCLNEDEERALLEPKGEAVHDPLPVDPCPEPVKNKGGRPRKVQ